MKSTRLKKIEVIQTENPDTFQDRFNEAMEKLAEFEPVIEFQHFNGREHCVYITYEEIKREFDRVSDEFHAEGIHYLCDQCPLHDPAEDGRQKYVYCKYADCGMTNLKREACEVFYKMIKQNEITPIY